MFMRMRNNSASLANAYDRLWNMYEVRCMVENRINRLIAIYIIELINDGFRDRKIIQIFRSQIMTR